MTSGASTRAEAIALAPVALPARASVPRVLTRAFWFGLAPVALAVGATWLVLPEDAHAMHVPSAARFLMDSPLLVGVALYLFFAVLLRYWRGHLPGARWLADGAVTRAGWRDHLALAATVGLALAAALVLRGGFYESFQVMSPSMLPGLLPFDRALASKRAYAGGGAPRRGDVVIFAPPEPMPGPPRVVKRVIGLPGDLVTMNNGHAVINGWSVPTCDAGVYVHPSAGDGTVGRLLVEFLDDQAYLTVHTAPLHPFTGAYEVKPGEVFVLGDNRNQSIDSRAFGHGQGGGVALAAIVGRVDRVVGGGRNGGIDWKRFGHAPGLAVPMPGVDASALEAGIAKCLATGPHETTPPKRAR